METKLLEWEAKEFEHYERPSGWYFTFFAVAFLVIAYEVYLRDWFGAITLLIIGAVFYFFSKMTPKVVHVVITDKAIEADRARFTYNNIKDFWIVEFQGLQSLHFETTAYLNRFITIMLDGQDPEEVREVLKKYLPEVEDRHEGIARRLSRHIKF